MLRSGLGYTPQIEGIIEILKSNVKSLAVGGTNMLLGTVKEMGVTDALWPR